MNHLTNISIAPLLANRIVLCSAGQSKEEVLSQLVKLICRTVPALDASSLQKQLLQREQTMSTTLDTGLSIPHIRVDEVEQVTAALAILPEALPDTSGKQIKAMFLFLSPNRSAFFQQHLQLLAHLAETFTPELLTRLSCAVTTQEVLEELEKRQ